MADCPIYGIGICGGALGLELGLEAAIPGYRTAVVVERETSVAGRMGQRIEEGSLPELAWWDDVGTFRGRPWRGIIQVVSAGFPCQPFSVAGKRKGKADERWIWPDIARVIEEIEPEIVFLENVPGLLLQSDSDVDRWDMDEPSEDALGGFGTVLRDLARLGFNAEWTSIRASDVGASHGRKRVFILAYRDSARLRRYAWQHDGGSPPLSARSGECSGALEHTEPFGHERDAHSGWKAITGIEHISAPLADPGNGRVQEPRWGSEGRTGLGPAGAVVGNAYELGYPLRGDDSGLRECASVERTGGTVGNAFSARTDARQPVSGSWHPDREPSGDVENPTRSGEHGCDGQAGRDGRRGILETGEQLGDSESGGRGECGQPSQRVGFAHGANSELGIFAPGPADPHWESLLVRLPWLRPSYSQAEAESDLRDVADGMASLVAHERTGALRALGNGVVPLQAAVAFTVLLRRVIQTVNVERSTLHAKTKAR